MILHDTRPCTPSQHSAYRGYDATEGKVRTFAKNGRGYFCPQCQRRFFSNEQRAEHSCVHPSVEMEVA